jgi:4-amino-4-deoxy-L-arabinose transferase-like glycosyltransferase
MPDAPFAAPAAAAPRRPLALEMIIVVILAGALLLPGLSRYSLVDPWETHYGEVARRMLDDQDWVHTTWQNEGFRSKPVLTFWLMAASMKALGVADDGGYSGELPESTLTMTAIRLPFALFGVLGLAMIWWMLARLVSRRAAYLGALAVGSAPFYALVSRQGITDIPLVVCVMGAVAMFAMASEDDRPIEPFWRLRLGRRGRGFGVDMRHVAFLFIGGIVVVQALYYAHYFTQQPQLARGIRVLMPNLILPLGMLGLLTLLVSGLWYWPQRLWRTRPFIGLALSIVLGLALGMLAGLSSSPGAPLLGVVKGFGYGALISGAIFLAVWTGLRRITRTRQVYMMWFWAFLGVSILAKGPPALAIVGVTVAIYVIAFHRWRELWDGHYELKRGLILMIAIAIPWHVAMYWKEGLGFYKEYVQTHVLNRATAGVDNEAGPFSYYLSQLGVGMTIWAALIPSALAGMLHAVRFDRRDPSPEAQAARVRILIGIWAIATVAFFSIVTTKFHHYILPAVPPLCLLGALWLDDVAAGRTRPSVMLGLLGAGMVLLISRDLVFEESLWIEMFVFRYDRPWPSAPPWQVVVSDGMLAIGVASAAALLLLLWLGRKGRLARAAGVSAIAVAALAGSLWALHVYMPQAGKHWGMREAVRAYYQQRTIYGQRLVYFGDRQLYDDWHAVTPGPDGTARWRFESMLPDTLQIGQPMTVRIQVNRTAPAEQTRTERDLTLDAVVARASGHTIELAIPAAELTKLRPALEAGKKARQSGVRPVKEVDADRLIAAQIYWRGEAFWSGNEIAGWLPEMKTDWGLKDGDNKLFTAYLSDANIAPLGRRYFVISEASRPGTLRSALPTARAKATWEQLNTESNKFTLSAFWL